MDLDSIAGLNEIRPSVYRASMKLLSLQKLCQLDVVSLRHIAAVLCSVGGAVGLNRQEVTRTLNRMFHNVSQEVPGHGTTNAPEEAVSLMFRLFDRTQTGLVPAASLQTALICLSSDTLLIKYRALVTVAESGSGSVSRSGLRSLLQDISQVPAAVQEGGVFGTVEAAVKSCFNGVLTPTAGKEHVVSWLQGEPPLLLWLPTLYRLSVSQNVSHSVRCHACKTRPIKGLRYRCMKCVNVHVCQSCFLTHKQTRKHKHHHPLLEFCTQPTLGESLSSLVHSIRHALFPRRYTQREADRRGVLMWAEPAETQNSAPPPTDLSTPLAGSAVSHSPSFDREVSHDASGRSPPRSFSKSLQTDEETQLQQSSFLIADVRNLQRDKWLLEQQLQTWQLTVQSEQGILEDRCSEMEVTMEKLREDNMSLQDKFRQALNKLDAQQNADTPRSINQETGSDITQNNEDEEVLLNTDEWSEEEQGTPSPTMHRNTTFSHIIQCEEEEESAGDRFLCHPIEQQDEPEGGGAYLSEEEDCGTCTSEELLHETVGRLKTVMETDRWTERQTGQRKWAELLEAAEQVGDAIHHLVDTVRTNAEVCRIHNHVPQK